MIPNQKVIFFTTAFVFLIFLSGCQQKSKMGAEPVTQKVAPIGEPKIQFENMIYDFGKVGPGQKLIGQFRFTNTGGAPLKVTKVEKCCGAVTTLDKEEITPGESDVLHVHYTSSRMAGTMSKHLYVNSNDKTTPRAMLTIKAEVIVKVDCEPKNLKLLLKENNIVCPKLTLTSTDNQPFSITSFKATGDYLIADFDPNVKATKFVLEPEANMKKWQGSPFGHINIGVAFSQPSTPPELISVVFRTISRFTVRPSMLLMMYSDAGKPIKQNLSITSNNKEDFQIESTFSKEGHIKILSQRKIGNQYEFRLEITPPGQDAKRFSDTFTVNLKGGETLEVACRGFYKAPAAKSEGK